ncbi:MAG: 4Fe-4S binding protein [Clostridia bacterium]|nr:4Fe-4S binding protein [Clostridia bacterium]
MKKFFVKVKDWFVAHKPTKRRIIQLYAALLTNANLKGFVSGKIYTGDTKKMCVPGLNCYSCPGAVGACPLGALQDSLAQSGRSAPSYILGILLLFGLLLGRLICGFLCPFGLIQELLYKIRTPKLRKSRFTRVLSYFKYVLLAIVIAIPLIYAGIPSFCKYVCPAGTFGGAISLLSNGNNTSFFSMLGYLFTWKFCVLVVVVVASVFIYRFFCRFICPLGAIYSLFCKISLLGVKLDKEKCIDCGLCIQGCKMDIKHVGDHECIQCGECISVCPVQAISWKGSKIFLRNTTPVEQPAVVEGEKIPLLELAKSNAGETISSPVQSSVQAVQSVELEKAETEETAVAQETEAVEIKAEKPKNKKLLAVKAAFKKPRFVVEFVAWVLALAVLISALVCYNLPEQQKQTIPAFKLTTYESAASEAGKDFSSISGSKIKLMYFWRTDLEESVSAMPLMNEFANSVNNEYDVVAVHSIYKDDRDVQAFIDEQGWNDYNITFVQDDMENNIYALFGGDISVPKPISAVLSENFIHSISETLPSDVDELVQRFERAKADTVYNVGDMCPLFELDRYNAEEGAKFSVFESRGKVTVLNFWYTDCDPCKRELPEFEKVYADYNGEINMVAIHSATGVPRGGVQNFLDNNVDKNGKRWNSYTLWYAQTTRSLNVYNMLGGRGAWPMTIVLDKEGRISSAKFDSCSEEQLRAAIEKAAQATE